MPTFVNLPAPTSDGAGTAVDTSALGAYKTIQCSGSATMTVNIEFSNDAAATVWSPVHTFNLSKGDALEWSLPVVARWMRASVLGNGSGSAPVVNVGG